MNNGNPLESEYIHYQKIDFYFKKEKPISFSVFLINESDLKLINIFTITPILKPITYNIPGAKHEMVGQKGYKINEFNIYFYIQNINLNITRENSNFLPIIEMFMGWVNDYNKETIVKNLTNQLNMIKSK